MNHWSQLTLTRREDPVRREVLWEENDNPVSTIALTEVMVLHCLSRGRTVILKASSKWRATARCSSDCSPATTGRLSCTTWM